MSGEDRDTRRGLDPSGLWFALVVGAAAAAGVLLLGQERGGYRPPPPEPWAGWKVVGVASLILTGALATGLVVYALIRLALSVAAAWHAQQQQRVLGALSIERTASQAEADKARAALEAARLVPWTEHGRLGALVRQTPYGWQVVNLDAEAGALLLGEGGGIDRLLADPLTVHQMEARLDLEKERARAGAYPRLSHYTQRLQIAGGDVNGEGQPPAPNWPARINLGELAPNPAALGSLVLGAAIDPGTGVARPVTAALSDLVHVAVGGSSGWGKSVFLRMLVLQLATAAEPCNLALIDLEGVTFSPFAGANRLLWPVADTEAGALAIMGRLVEEMNRRRALYAAYPGVDNLAAYNRQVAGNGQVGGNGDKPEALLPVVCLIDEATALLADRSVHGATRTLALRARKYGLWLVLGGQDWKAANVDTTIRNQLSTRVHFRAQSASQSRVLLGDGRAAAIDVPGRAWAQLPGRPLLEIQAPMVSVADIEAALAGQSGPAGTLPGDGVGRHLTELEAHLVLWAVEQNEGRFSVRAVADAHSEQVSRGRVQALAARLAAEGWLVVSDKENTAPEVTADLEAEARQVLAGGGV